MTPSDNTPLYIVMDVFSVEDHKLCYFLVDNTGFNTENAWQYIKPQTEM